MNAPANHWRRDLSTLLVWCVLLVLAWGLALWRLDASDLTFDEAATYRVAHQPLREALRSLQVAVREHPPVYYVLMCGWMRLTGASEFGMRFFSVCASLIAVALTGWLCRLVARRLSSARSYAAAVSLSSSALLAVMPGMVAHARDARMYSLGVVWTLLSAGLFLRDWLPANRWPRRAAWVCLAGVHLLALFTHYYLLLPILVQPLLLMIARRWRPLAAWCALHASLAFAGLGWFWLSPGLQATVESLWIRFDPALPAPREVFILFSRILFSPAVPVNFRLVTVLLLLIGSGTLVVFWKRRPAGAWLALSLVFPPILAYLLPHPPAPRHLIFVMPLAALALGVLCALPLHLRTRWLARGATLVLAAGGIWLMITSGLSLAITAERSQYGRTLEMVKAYAHPGDQLLFYGPWQWIQFNYYDPGGLPPITTLPPQAPPHLDPAEAEPALEALLARSSRLWVIPAAVSDVDPSHFVEGWLRTHAHAVWETKEMSLYLPPLPGDAPVQPVGLSAGQTLILERVAYEPQPTPAGEPLRLTLTWELLETLERDVQLTLVLVDREGHIWNLTYVVPCAWASPPSTWQPGQAVTDYEGLMIPQGAPPGEYRVRLRVEDAVTGVPLLIDGEQEVDILAIQVVEPAYPAVLIGLPNGSAVSFCAPGGADCLTLAGYEPGGLRFQQGYPAALTLHWLAPYRIEPGVQVRLTAVHRAWLPGLQGAPIVTKTLALPSLAAPVPPAPALPERPTAPFQAMLPLVLSNYPIRPSDRLLTLPVVLTLPPDAATGASRILLEVMGPDGTRWTTEAGEASLALFDIAIEERPVLHRLPGGLTAIQANFGDEIGLRGYRVEGNPQPGGQLRITYAWHALAHPTKIYAVFNHLLALDGSTVAQADSWPQGGRMLTVQWQEGEYIEDTHVLDIPADAPPGPYTLVTGLYDASNDERQPATLDGQRLPGDCLSIPLPGEGGR